MKKFEKILLLEDLDKLKEMVNHVNKLKPHLIDLKQKYEALELGTFTNLIFQELIKKGTKNIENKYVKFLNKELDNVGIKSTLIRNNLTKESGKQFEFLKQSLSSLKAFKIPYYGMYKSHQLPLELIFYSDRSEAFYVNDENEKIIKENFCTLYIETFEQKQIYDSFSKIKDAYNELLEITKENSKIKNSFEGLESLKKYIIDSVEHIQFKSLQSNLKNSTNRAIIDDNTLMDFIKFLTNAKN